MRVVSEYFAGGEAGKPDEVMEPCTQLFLPDLMNAEVSAQYLEILLETYPDVTIILFWDRAPWHRGKPSDQVLEQHPRLEIIFFPTASPDLNPQEQVGKAVRKDVSHNHMSSISKNRSVDIKSFANGEEYRVKEITLQLRIYDVETPGHNLNMANH